MFSRRRGLAIAFAGAVLVAACGGGSGSGGGGEADKPVDQIIADVQAALQSAKSFHVNLTLTSQKTTSKFDLDTSGTGKVKGMLTSGSATGQLIIADGYGYFKGKALIAALFGDQAAAQVGERFVRVAADQLGGLEQVADAALFSKCLFDAHGTITKGNTVTINGHSAIELKDAGDKPGTQPGVLSVQTDGAAYPLRTQTTGVRKAGGNALKECGGPSDTDQDQQAVADFSNFGSKVDVTAPTDFVS
jgi:hypothetical protein